LSAAPLHASGAVPAQLLDELADPLLWFDAPAGRLQGGNAGRGAAAGAAPPLAGRRPCWRRWGAAVVAGSPALRAARAREPAVTLATAAPCALESWAAGGLRLLRLQVAGAALLATASTRRARSTWRHRRSELLRMLWASPFPADAARRPFRSASSTSTTPSRPSAACRADELLGRDLVELVPDEDRALFVAARRRWATPAPAAWRR
jgi:hypothetical protein